MTENELQESLIFTRERLRKEYMIDDTPPLICSDEAISAMVEHKPLRFDQLKKIEALDERFIQTFADDFHRVILQYHRNNLPKISLTKYSKKVLKLFNARLSQISRDNRNLRIRQSSRFLVDLNNKMPKKRLLMNIINGYNVNIRLTDRENEPEMERDFYNKIKTLFLEYDRQRKENTFLELFLTYPYVEGRYSGEEDFFIRAPLLYVPVILEKIDVDYYLSFDKKKEIQVNKDLVFASNKFNSEEGNIDHDQIKVTTADDLENDIIKFYRKKGVNIIDKPNNALKFGEKSINYDTDYLENHDTGNLVLEPYVGLGLFPTHASAIQADISAILKKADINELISDLFNRYNFDEVHEQKNEPTYQPELSQEGELPDGGFYERDIRYISPLNYAQEKVIFESNSHKKIVVWGPPGTGKSQTITNLIANGVVSNKHNILVVSTKKAALDVIKSRLGINGQYAMFADNPSDKQAFYDQLDLLFENADASSKILTQEKKQSEDEKAVDEIHKILSLLRKTSKEFYKKDNRLKVELVEIYPRYTTKEVLNTKLSNLPISIKPIVAYGNINKLKIDDYRDLRDVEQIFNNLIKEDFDFFKNSLYFRSKPDFPFKSLKKGINNLDLYEILDKKDELITNQQEWANTIWFKRRRLKKRFIKKYRPIFTEIFEDNADCDNLLKKLFDEPKRLNDLLEYYQDFIDTQDKQIMYLDSPVKETYFDIICSYMKNTKVEIKQEHLLVLNQVLFDLFYTNYINDVEKSNNEICVLINNYEKYLKRLDNAIDKKRKLVANQFNVELKENLGALFERNKFKEIRTVTRKRPDIGQFLEDYHHELLAHLRIWVMTPEAVSELLPLEKGLFDVVVFDEASQMHSENAIPVLYRARRAIVAGDAQQLRPSTFAMSSPSFASIEDDDRITQMALDAESFLDLAQNRFMNIILNFHYRSQYEELIAFSNSAFYNNKLIISPNRQKTSTNPIKYVYVEDGIWNEGCNKAEVEKIVEMLRDIFQTRKNNESIGIITFNQPQKQLIHEHLTEISEQRDHDLFAKYLYDEMNREDNFEDSSLFVKNIENVQGDERDIIIFSLGYANNKDGKFMRNFGALNKEGGENRLNVAITRAKQKIYFVASMSPSEFKVADLKSRGPVLLGQYMRYCLAVDERNNEEIRSILRTVRKQAIKEEIPNWRIKITEKVKSALIEKGYEVHQDVGVGKELIDLAIWEKNSGKYLLGLICDVKGDVNQDQVRNYFYHQEKYLENHGWKMYRVFSADWWKNSSEVLKTIVSHIETVKKLEA